MVRRLLAAALATRTSSNSPSPQLSYSREKAGMAPRLAGSLSGVAEAKGVPLEPMPATEGSGAGGTHAPPTDGIDVLMAAAAARSNTATVRTTVAVGRRN